MLLAIPAYPLFVGLSPSPPGFPIALDYLPVSLAQIAPIYLPPLALLFLAIVAAHRGSVRSARSGIASSHARSTRWPGES